MDHWQRIFDNLSLPTTTTLYIGVGSSMEYYTEVTEQNNQQYPCFLNDFEGSHLVILIDPCMESDLKLFTYFEQVGDPVMLVNQTNWDNTQDATCASSFWINNVKSKYPGSIIPHVREFYNSVGRFFIINDCFYPEVNAHMSESQIAKSSESISILYQLITIALGKIKPSKVIYQDYTGYDTTNCFSSLFDIFGRENVLSNVCFDVTQQDGGCFIELKPNMIQFDEAGNFFQEKYEQLTKIPNSPNYNKILRSRIDILSYPTIWNYINLKSSNSFVQLYPNTVKRLASLYEIEFSPNEKHDRLLDQYLRVITVVIRDIVRSREIDDEFANYLLENLTNRSEFTNAINILKFE